LIDQEEAERVRSALKPGDSSLESPVTPEKRLKRGTAA
jgi:hypothetical protein